MVRGADVDDPISRKTFSLSCPKNEARERERTIDR